jgi:hypothetical protein
MKPSDLQAIEKFVEEFCHEHDTGRLPVTISTEYDRVDIDLTYCRLSADLVQDWLAQRMGRLGYLYDVWFPDKEPHSTLCVSEKGADE